MSERKVLSPGVGKVVELLVDVGAAVAPSQQLIVIESMKMEIPLAAGHAGRVAAVAVAPGDLVQEGDLLLTIAE